MVTGNTHKALVTSQRNGSYLDLGPRCGSSYGSESLAPLRWRYFLFAATSSPRAYKTRDQPACSDHPKIPHTTHLPSFLITSPMPTYHLHVPHGYTVRDSHSHSPSRGYPGSHHPDSRVHDRPYRSSAQHDLSRYPTSSGRGSQYYDSSGPRRHHGISHGGEYYSTPSRSSHAHSDVRHSQPVYYTDSAHSHYSRSPSHRRRSHSHSVNTRDTGRHHHTLVAPRYTATVSNCVYLRVCSLNVWY